MSNEVDNYTPADLSRIDVRDMREVEWWSRKLGVSAQQLRMAVKMVGLITGDVQKQLAG